MTNSRSSIAVGAKSSSAASTRSSAAEMSSAGNNFNVLTRSCRLQAASVRRASSWQDARSSVLDARSFRLSHHVFDAIETVALVLLVAFALARPRTEFLLRQFLRQLLDDSPLL